MNGPRLWVAEALDAALWLVITPWLLASDWLSQSALIACCAILERRYLIRGRDRQECTSPDIGVESGERGEWRLESGDMEIRDISFTQSLSIVISLIRELISCHILSRNGITLSLWPRGADWCYDEWQWPIRAEYWWPLTNQRPAQLCHECRSGASLLPEL